MATIRGKRILTNLYLDPEVHAALQKLSEKTGVSMAHYLRKAASQVLAEHGIKTVKARR